MAPNPCLRSFPAPPVCASVAAGGAIVGLGAAAFLARLVAAMLFGVSATDPLTYGGAALFVVGVAAAASLVAARRASHVEPLVALRQT